MNHGDIGDGGSMDCTPDGGSAFCKPEYIGDGGSNGVKLHGDGGGGCISCIAFA